MNGENMNQAKVSCPNGRDFEVVRLSDLAAQWQTKKYGQQIQEQVLKNSILVKIREATALIKDSATKQDSNSGDHVCKMEWDQLYDISANIMDEYTKNVDRILNQLDQLYRVCVKQQLRKV